MVIDFDHSQPNVLDCLRDNTLQTFKAYLDSKTFAVRKMSVPVIQYICCLHPEHSVNVILVRKRDQLLINDRGSRKKGIVFVLSTESIAGMKIFSRI